MTINGPRRIHRLSLLAALVFSAVTTLAFGVSGAQAMPADGGPSGGSNPNAAQQAACEGSGGTWVSNTCSTPGSSRTLMSTIRQIVDILVFIIGAVAVLMIIIAGLRYVFAQGDNAAITAAKNTILYAIVGIVVATAAYGIVNFVLAGLK